MVAITSARGLEIDTNKGPLLLITFMLIRKYDKKKIPCMKKIQWATQILYFTSKEVILLLVL
jgi:hypothetical protein